MGDAWRLLLMVIGAPVSYVLGWKAVDRFLTRRQQISCDPGTGLGMFDVTPGSVRTEGNGMLPDRYIIPTTDGYPRTTRNPHGLRPKTGGRRPSRGVYYGGQRPANAGPPPVPPGLRVSRESRPAGQRANGDPVPQPPPGGAVPRAENWGRTHPNRLGYDQVMGVMSPQEARVMSWLRKHT